MYPNQSRPWRRMKSYPNSFKEGRIYLILKPDFKKRPNSLINIDAKLLNIVLVNGIQQ